MHSPDSQTRSGDADRLSKRKPASPSNHRRNFTVQINGRRTIVPTSRNDYQRTRENRSSNRDSAIRDRYDRPVTHKYRLPYVENVSKKHPLPRRPFNQAKNLVGSGPMQMKREFASRREVPSGRFSSHCDVNARAGGPRAELVDKRPARLAYERQSKQSEEYYFNPSRTSSGYSSNSKPCYPSYSKAVCRKFDQRNRKYT
ncbi:unnamed protein product [Heterobilharzia americana]|nr:unnamed protein product [Heterobilharzia americana]